MSYRSLLAAAAALAIATGSLAATTDGAFAKAPPLAPHYKPLICIFLPCAPTPMAPVKHHHHRHHHKAKPMMTKPVKK